MHEYEPICCGLICPNVNKARLISFNSSSDHARNLIHIESANVIVIVACLL